MNIKRDEIYESLRMLVLSLQPYSWSDARARDAAYVILEDFSKNLTGWSDTSVINEYVEKARRLTELYNAYGV